MSPAASSRDAPAPVLTVEELHLENRLTGERLVQGVSFTLWPGQVLGIVGESGSGKTLTCRALLGILPPQLAVAHGRVCLQGRDIATFTRADWSVARGAVISAVFQDPGSYLNPAATVGKQVEEVFRVKKGLSRSLAKQQVVRLFTLLHLREPELVYAQYPHELSGGMLQRILIATAIALDPQVLIADEATTALDVTVQAELLDLLLELKERVGLAQVVVSHDLAVIAQVCDEVLVMKDGQVVERGAVREILYAPKHPYTRLLIEEHNVYGLERFVSAPERSHHVG